ncbi:hypothetical protein Hanom_Chr15g01372751 [Helianthus anomalus]
MVRAGGQPGFTHLFTPTSLSCKGSMISGRRSACAGAGAQSNIASSRAGLTGDCL